MKNLKNEGGFHFFFIDDPVPVCFEQKAGTTFRSLLLGENAKGQKTYEGILSVFQNKPQELDAFISRFNELQNINSRSDFFQQKFIGNPEHHANLNNQVEWVFGKQGRIDACIIQQDGVRCVFILDVRPVSNHEKIADNPLHIQNRNLSDIITNAFNCTNYYKIKGAPFREGLLAYQNEHMETLNTFDARFSILLNTLEQLIFSNKDIYSKIAVFRNKLNEEKKGQGDFDANEFEVYIQRQLEGQDITEYQRELLTQLCQYDASSENHLTQENAILKSFSNISNVRGLAVSLFSNLETMFERENLKEKNVLDSFRIFNKIPPSYLYVLLDVYDDKSFDEESKVIQQRISYFLSQLNRLKASDGADLFDEFKTICKDAFEKTTGQEGSLPLLEATPPQDVFKRDNLFQDFLNIHVDKITTDSNVDKFSKALMKLIVEPSYEQMVLLVNNEANEQTLEDEKTLGCQWIATGDIDETIGKTFQRILREHPDLKEKICEKRPFLTPYVEQLGKGKLVNFDEIHTICMLYNLYCSDGIEDEFNGATEHLSKLNDDEKAFLEEYVVSVFSKTENHHSLLRFIRGAKSLLQNEVMYQKQLEEKRKEARSKKKTSSQQQSDKDIQRQNFIKAFEDFYFNVDDEEKLIVLKNSLLALDKNILARLKKLPGNTPIGIFIRDYLSAKDEKQEEDVFDSSIHRVVLKAREEKKDRLASVIDDFFDDFKNEDSLNKLYQMLISLSEEDISFMLQSWEEDAQKFERQIAFLGAYREHINDDFEVFLEKKLPSFSKIEAEEIKKRVLNFRNGFNSLFSDGDDVNVERLTLACLQLNDRDLKFLLDEGVLDLGPQEKNLLQGVRDIRTGKSKNIPEETKKLVLETKRKVVFQYSFNKLVKDFYDEERYEKFLAACVNMEKTDFDVFIEMNSDMKMVSKFFEKLKKLKNKKISEPAQKEGMKEALNHLRKKISFVRVANNFLMEPPQEEDFKKLATAFLNFTAEGVEGINEVCAENDTAISMIFLLDNMKRLKKEVGVMNFEGAVKDFVDKEGWKIEFFTTIDCYKAQNRESEIKNLLPRMELFEINAIIDTNMYANDVQMQNELKKQQFCKTVEEFCLSVFKDKDLERKTATLYTSLADTPLLDEILRETDADNDTHMFIVGVREFFRDCIYSELPQQALDNKKIKGIMSVSGCNFDQKLKAFIGARDFREGVLSFILDLREHNLAPTVVKKMRENIQHD